MKVLLLTLSGDPEKAHAILERRYIDAAIVPFPRSAIETGSMGSRLGALRAARPDVFAVMTESCAWQYGQDALMLFGALGGARESLIVDAAGEIRSEGRSQLIAFSPFRIARQLIRGKLASFRARRILDRLEREVSTTETPSRRTSGTSAPSRSILYVRATPAAGTHPGGATSHINGVVGALLGLGATVDFVSNDDIAGLDTEKVSFHKIAPDPHIMPRSAFDIHNGMTFSAIAARHAKGAPPDLIYQRYCRFSWAGVEASLLSGVPLFLEYNGSEVWIGKHWDKTGQLDLLERCERLNLKAASRIFVISEVERNNLLRSGVPAEKIVVNPNGVDTDEFRPGIGGREIREGFGVADDTSLVGFVGTFGPWHGVLALADAIALTPKDAKIQFLLVGDGSLRAEVEAKLRSSGDVEQVRFAGIVAHDRVPVLLDACDILVSPHVPLADGSEFFGSPTKLFEYMAMGKGIVASRLGQIGDVLEHNKTALFVEPGDPKALVDAILELAGDAPLLARLGAAARETAVAKHTWRRNAEHVLATFERLS